MQLDRETGKRHQETANEKLVRKFWENPFIPIGGVLTTGFLCNGLFKFGRRDSAGSQVMMRGRIAAQVLILIFSVHNTSNLIEFTFIIFKWYSVKPCKLIFNVIQFLARNGEWKFIEIFCLILYILSLCTSGVYRFHLVLELLSEKRMFIRLKIELNGQAKAIFKSKRRLGNCQLQEEGASN